MQVSNVNAPTGAKDDASPQSAEHAWPAPHEWPGADASAVVVAKFLRDRLGLRPFPTPNALDTAESAKHFFAEAMRDWSEDHPGKTISRDDEEMLRDVAGDQAHHMRKGPLAIMHKAFAEAAVITDQMIARAWGGDKATRGIAVALGRSTKGFPLAQVDVDPRHGGDDAETQALVASLDGPRATTPGGGLHVFVLGGDGLRSQPSGALAPGVELRTTGYAMVPSGQDGRAWVSVAPAAPAPERLRRPVHRVGSDLPAIVSPRA